MRELRLVCLCCGHEVAVASWMGLWYVLELVASSAFIGYWIASGGIQVRIGP